MEKHEKSYKTYKWLKEKHPDQIGLIEQLEFYESFGEDADKCGRILGITVSTCKYKDETVHYCLFPINRLDIYLEKLLRAGERIVIATSLEMVKESKIEREKKGFSEFLEEWCKGKK